MVYGVKNRLNLKQIQAVVFFRVFCVFGSSQWPELF